jgi:hypothetical protein
VNKATQIFYLEIRQFIQSDYAFVGVHVAFVGMGVVILARPEVAGTAYTFSGIRVIPYNEIQPPRHCNTAEPSALNRVVLIWMCSVVFRYSLLKTPAQGQLGRENLLQDYSDRYARFSKEM